MDTRWVQWSVDDAWRIDLLPQALSISIPMGETVSPVPLVRLCLTPLLQVHRVCAYVGVGCHSFDSPERLQENALATGQYIVERVRALQERFPCIGDVRGVGLYLGIEIICPRSEEDTIVPNPELTKFLVDFLMEQKVIVSKDGPQVNVIKLKPPLVFSETHADILIAALEEALIASEAQSR